ncbi:MAG: cation transporter [Polyangiaceae bacterium]
MKSCCEPKTSEPSAPAVGASCCAAKESELAQLGAHADIRRVLVVVLAINLTMFFVEFGAGMAAQSTSLMADSVDMLGDAIVYILSLYALKRSLRWRAGAAVLKGAIIALFGVSVAIEVAMKLVHGVTPQAGMMLAFGLLALGANLTCLTMLYRHRNRDVNMSSTFECSRNDVISNGGVLIAAGAVRLLRSGWPDIIVGAAIAILFFRSSVRVLRRAWPEFRVGRSTLETAANG